MPALQVDARSCCPTASAPIRLTGPSTAALWECRPQW